MYDGLTVTVVNSILWANTPDQIEDAGGVTVSFSVVEGGW
jgi:hypothetical protein